MKDTVSRETLIEIIKPLIAQQLETFVREHEIKAKEVSLLERISRVEEELKAQREIIASLQREMIARFEAMDKRFEAMNERFEAVDKHFEVVEKRFEALQREMDRRFEAVDRRFEAVNIRFESLERRLSFLQWFMAGGFTFLSILITLINLLR